MPEKAYVLHLHEVLEGEDTTAVLAVYRSYESALAGLVLSWAQAREDFGNDLALDYEADELEAALDREFCLHLDTEDGGLPYAERAEGGNFGDFFDRTTWSLAEAPLYD